MKKVWCSVLMFASVCMSGWASDLNYPKKVINGKTYYEYTVQKSEGFYSICKRFNVSEDEIKSVNPGTEKGLAYDSVILIPYKQQPYTVHKVDRKETLYSISKKYGVTYEDLYEMNPSLKTEGLKSGTEIKIPDKKSVSVQTMTVSDTLTKIEKENKPTFTVHEVKKGETLYSISRTYGISSDEIVKLNPDVKDGVKIGKKLIIPPVHSGTTISSTSVEGKNTQFRTHVVKKRETLYSISKEYNVTHEEIVKLNPNINDGLKEGMILIIPPSFGTVAEGSSVASDSVQTEPTLIDSIGDLEKLFTRSYVPKKEINVAIALPYQLSKSTDKSKIDGNTNKFLEFYQGFLIAVDSLRKQGLSFNVYTYDSGKSESEIKSVLAKPEMKNLDLLIGPAYGVQIKAMSEFALENNIKLIIPFSSKSDETKVNPNIFQLNPPQENVSYTMADLFINQFKGKNIVLWRFKNATYDDKKVFADTLEAMLKARGVDYKKVIYDNLATIRAAIVADKENIVVPLTTNQVALSLALPMVNMLQTDKKSVSLFGFSEWQGYQSISKELYVLPTYFATPFHVDFTNPEVKSYLKWFRHYYNAEPFNSQPQYGMLGYDVLMYFATSISKNGHDFEFRPAVEVNTLQSKFNFSRIAEKGGFCTSSMYLVNHNEKTGLTAVDGTNMQMCPNCAKKLEKKK